MAGFGDKLRYKRMGMGLTVKEASKKAKIKQKHLNALEEENVLIFRDKETIIALIKKYAPVLGLDQEEMLADFNALWTDARTAKAYLQQTYKKSRGLGISFEKVPVYGAVVLAAALFLLVGGYLAWDYITDPSRLGEEAVPGVVADETSPPEDNGERIITAEEQAWQDGAGIAIPEETDPGEREYAGAMDREVEAGNENEKEEVTDEDEKVEEIEEDTYKLEQEGEPVPRTGGNSNLFYTGLYFIISGLLLLLSTHDPIYSNMIKRSCLSGQSKK